MALRARLIIALLCFCSIEACALVRRPLLPSPPVPSCTRLSYKQTIALYRLFWRSLAPPIGQGFVEQCQNQCGYVLYAGDRDPAEIERQVPDTVEGWPVCVQAGSPQIVGQALAD